MGAYTQAESYDHNLTGHDIVHAGDLGPKTGNYYGITIVADAVVDSITYETHFNTNSDGDLSDLASLPAGLYIPCQFTSITLASGEAILHSI